MPLSLTDADTQTLHAAHTLMQRIVDTTQREGRDFSDGIVYHQAHNVTDATDTFLITLGVRTLDADTKEWAAKTLAVLHHRSLTPTA